MIRVSRAVDRWFQHTDKKTVSTVLKAFTKKINADRDKNDRITGRP